jgi:hypothetical protein
LGYRSPTVRRLIAGMVYESWIFCAILHYAPSAPKQCSVSSKQL